MILDRIRKAADQLMEAVSPRTARNRAIARWQTRRIQASGYGNHGASNKNALRGWLWRGGSPDEDIVEHINVLRERSRDMYCGTPLATGALKKLATEVVGSGLRPASSIDYDYLGISADQAADWEHNTEREWDLFTRHSDAARTLTFGQQQSLAFLSVLMSGDVFATMPVVHRPGCVYSTRVQLIEADRVADPWEISTGSGRAIVSGFSQMVGGVSIRNYNGRDVLGGVEVGEYGDPVAYWIAKYHPLSRDFRGALNEWRRVPAFGPMTGRRNVLHLFTPERPGQRRGVPILAPVIEALKQLGRYTENELMAAVVSSMLTVFIESEAPDSVLGSSLDPDQELNIPNSIELGNGAVVGLGPGEKVATVNPSRPNTAFDGFIRSVSVQIGAALQMPYEILLQHFTSSYTAARASFVEFWKVIQARRDWLASGFCQPVYEEWLSEAVANGRIQAPGFFEDAARRTAWCHAAWYGPAQGQINERVEVNAAFDRVKYGFSTMEAETAAMNGRSWDEVNRTRAQEIRRMREAGTLQNGSSTTEDTPDQSVNQ